MLNTIIAIITAIPALNSMFQTLVTAYTASKLAQMKRENVDAIRKAIYEFDQRNLESAIGSPTPGQPSGDAGAVIIDHPPAGIGVPDKGPSASGSLASDGSVPDGMRLKPKP